jgi:hypothetical protein
MPRRKVDNVARFVWVIDGEPDLQGVGPNRTAASVTVEAVRSAGKLEDVDVALVTAFELLAEAVDHDPTNAALWGQYRAAEVAVRGVGASETQSAFDRFLAELSTADSDSPKPQP